MHLNDVFCMPYMSHSGRLLDLIAFFYLCHSFSQRMDRQQIATATEFMVCGVSFMLVCSGSCFLQSVLDNNLWGINSTVTHKRVLGRSNGSKHIKTGILSNTRYPLRSECVLFSVVQVWEQY